MVKFTLKNTTVIILILACLGNLVKSQKQEKNATTEVRSLGHRRGGYLGEQTVFVDRPYFVDQPVYYSYPYQYQYPYSYTYTYPYTYSYQYPYLGVPGYPYNYSYSYTRTTSRPGGVFTRPVGYVSPLPYAPLPGPYFRYLGNDSESNERKMDILTPMETMTPEFINDLQLQDGILSNGNQNNNLKNPNESLMQRNQTSTSSTSGNNGGVNNLLNRDGGYLERFPTLTGLNRAGLSGNERIIVQDNRDEEEEDDDHDDENEDNNHDKKIKNNPSYNVSSVSNDGKKYNDTASPVNTPEIVYYNNTSNLRVLAKKGLLERVEEKVNDVFDGLKKKSNGSDDEVKDLEKEDADENNKKNNTSGNDNKKNQNGSKMIKQVFSTIEDIVSNTLSK